MVSLQPEPGDWQPTQVRLKEPVDLRFSAAGPKGYKINPIKTRKRTRPEDLASAAAAAAAGQEGPVDMEEDGALAQEDAPKRQRLDGEIYRKVSGKTWKAPGTKAGAAKSAVIGTSWEKKMADKRTRQLFNEQKQAAVAAVKEKRKAAAQQRAAAKERKKQNQAKSAVVQQISAATAKKLLKSKKQRKLVRTQ